MLVGKTNAHQPIFPYDIIENHQLLCPITQLSLFQITLHLVQRHNLHLRKFDFLLVGHAESTYRSRSALFSLLLCRQTHLFDLCPSDDDLSEVLKISVTPAGLYSGFSWSVKSTRSCSYDKYLKTSKQVKPWHQMNTHVRNSSIIFKNSCPRKISNHPNRCYLTV